MNEDKQLFEIALWSEAELLKLVREINRKHGNYQKAQYIKKEAYELMHDDDESLRKKGAVLMEKMIELFPDEHLSTMAGHSCLGKYYRSVGEYDAALSHFKQVLTHNNASTSKFDMPEMQIALTIIMLEHVDKYNYARSVLDKVNPKTLFIKEHLRLYELMLAVLDGKCSPREVREYYRLQRHAGF